MQTRGPRPGIKWWEATLVGTRQALPGTGVDRLRPLLEFQRGSLLNVQAAGRLRCLWGLEAEDFLVGEFWGVRRKVSSCCHQPRPI